MSWAEVKKINSDMSVPLDKLIKSQRSLGASDAVMAVPVSTNISTSRGEKRLLATFKPIASGSIRLLTEMRSSMNQHAVILSIEENGTEKSFIRTAKTSYEQYTLDVEVSAEKLYNVYIYGDEGALINFLKICASVIDTSLLGYTIGG